jgi:Ca-activated chloride channel family protein
MGNYLSWQNSSALQLLWLVPLLVVLLLHAAGRRSASLRAFLGERFVPADWRWHRRRRLLKGALWALALALLIVAAARPKIGTELQKVKRVGADIVFVMDTSDSMLAQDVAPSRLEAAKEAAQALIGRLQGDRIGLVVFAGSAYLYSPLTVDHDAAAMFVDSVERGSAPAPGTAMGDAIESAARLLQQGEHQYRCIVLFSDGEDHEGLKPETVRAARSQGIVTHAIGFGGSEGEPIPVPNERDGDALVQQFFGDAASMPQTDSPYKRDASGKVVMTRLNEKALTEVAKEGGGVFVKSSPSGANVDRVYQAIAGMESGSVGTYQFSQYAERFQWPLGAAILLIVLEMLIAPAPRRRGGDRDAPNV